MIKTVGDFICIHESFIRKSAVDSINLSESSESARCFFVSVATKQMLYTVTFYSQEDQLNYSEELLALLNE